MSIFYIPRKQDGDWQGAFESLATQLREIKTSHVLDDEKIKELEDKFQKHGVNSYDGLKTYAKNDLILFGDMTQQAFFYKSLQDNNTGHWPSAPESSSWWMMIAGDYISRFFGDVTGYSTDNVVSKVGGASATDIVAVTAAIKSGELDHPTALTIGESTPVINIGTGAAPKTINLGGAGDTVAVAGNLVTVNTDNLQVTDSLIRLNRKGLAGSAADAGIEIEEAGAVAAYVKTNGTRDGFVLKAPAGNEYELNQSVATGSSPSFQTLATTGHVQAGGYLRAQTFTNPIGVGSYLAHGSSSMPGAAMFMNQPGSDPGEWRWSMYKSTNNWLSDAMTLTKGGSLTASGYVNSSGLYSNKGLAVNSWDNDMIANNYGFIGRNRTGATGRMSFGCHRGGGQGGFDWVSYSISGEEGTPMTLTRDGHLATTGSIKGQYLQVTGNTTPTEPGGYMCLNSTNPGWTDMWFNLHRGSKNAGSWWWKDYTNSASKDVLKLDAGNQKMTMYGTIEAREGLTVTAGSTSLQDTTITGNLTVTGTINGGGSTQTQTLSGAWTIAFNNAAATIKVTRTSNIIHLTMGMFSAFPISASAQAVYNLGLPSWARPDADVSVITFIVPFSGGTEPNYITMVIQQNGAMALKPPNKFDVSNLVGFNSGYTVVSYPVSA